jgi:hypothetical protein
VRAILVASLAAVVVVTGSASGQQTPASSYGEAVFVVSGRGYGHGVGMSQYGAYGQALAGRTYEQILAHYYTGTQIGRPVARSSVSARRGAARGHRVVDRSVHCGGRDGAVYKLPKGSLTLRSDLSLPSDVGRSRRRSR